MIALHRVTVSFINAVFISALLLCVMYALIKSDDPELRIISNVPVMKLARIPEDEEVKPIVPPPPKPIEPEEQPPKLQPIRDFVAEALDPHPLISYNHKRKGEIPQIENRQLVRIFGQPGNYPSRQLRLGIEGYVVVGFSVDDQGGVFDAFVIESSPSGAFDRSALKAIEKFKYRSRTVEGKAVSTDGQQYMFTYKIDS